MSKLSKKHSRIAGMYLIKKYQRLIGNDDTRILLAMVKIGVTLLVRDGACDSENVFVLKYYLSKFHMATEV